MSRLVRYSIDALLREVKRFCCGRQNALDCITTKSGDFGLQIKLVIDPDRHIRSPTNILAGFLCD